ncbi:MAG: glycosyltransferase [Pedosphaera sp.]|nr:glycosyltransferase [Pedosphaera sp.]
MATVFFRQGDFRTAQEYARLLTIKTPLQPSSWIQLSAVSLKLDDIPEFEMALEKAIELDPENPDAILLLAHATFQAENYLEAARLYARVIRMRPDSAEAAMAFGVCCAKTGLNEEAVEMFQRVLELDPNNVIARENIQSLEPEPISVKPAPVPSPAPAATQEATLDQSKMGKQKAPPVALVGAIQESETLLKKGRHLDAWNSGLRAISERPFNPDAYLHLTEIALDAGDERQAYECILRLLKMTPSWDIPRNVEKSLNKQTSLKHSKFAWPPLPKIVDQPSLTVCMIVKNEEAVLARCLKSVHSIAQQIIVVDTGSTDRTVEIAKEYGAEVHAFTWNDNFSDARNHGLQFARQDWVLILDADEELLPESVAKLRHDMAQPNQLGYRIPLKNFTETADGTTYVPRLFRNAPGLHFVFRVHEQIFSSVVVRKCHWQMKSGLGTALLMHYGYDPEVKRLKNKVQRNLDLLKLAIVENPGEVGLLMNYGLDLVNAGRGEEALAPFREAIAIMSKYDPQYVLPEVRERLLTIVSFHLLQSEEYEELIQLAESRLTQDTGPTASLHYTAALALIRTQRKNEAIPHLRACLEKRGQPTLTPETHGVKGAAPHHLLADCLANAGAHAESEAQFKLALAACGRSVAILHSYAKFLTLVNRPTEAIQLLFNSIQEGETESDLWSLGCVITNGHLKDSEVALDWTESAVQAHPDHREIRKQRGIALLTVGQFSEAIEQFNQLTNATDPATVAAKILCQVAIGIRPSAVSEANELNTMKEFVFWLRRLLEYRNEKSANQVIQNATLLEDVLPSAARVLKESSIDS